jgi:dihydrofolate reductase
MRKLIYAMTQSLDGYIEDRHGKFDFSVPDTEVHQSFNDLFDHVDTMLHGRRTWELMTYWFTADQDPDLVPVALDFAKRFQKAKHYAFSRTLTQAGHGATLVSGDAAQTVKALKAQSGGDITVSGPSLASQLTRAGLVDEYWLYFAPVAIGAGGKPFFLDLNDPLELSFIDSHVFSNGTVRLRYRRNG